MKNLSLIIALSFVSFFSFSQNPEIEICQNSHNTFMYQDGENSIPLYEIRAVKFDGEVGHIELRKANSYDVYLIIKRLDRSNNVEYYFYDQQIETLKSVYINIVDTDMINHINNLIG
tara:strand:- start:836 stop:1186 length:351 start_codon:yes stop_codon:yes gene_type:complete